MLLANNTNLTEKDRRVQESTVYFNFIGRRQFGEPACACLKRETSE